MILHLIISLSPSILKIYSFFYIKIIITFKIIMITLMKFMTFDKFISWFVYILIKFRFLENEIWYNFISLSEWTKMEAGGHVIFE